MAGFWIRMRTNLWNDGRVRLIERVTGTSRATVTGALFRLWSLADDHTTDGELLGWDAEQLDAEVGITGFAKALTHERIGWLKITPDSLIVEKFEEHNGESAKARADAADRQKRSRESRKGHADVTKSCDISVTPSVSVSVSPLSIKERITDKIRENLAGKGIGPEELDYWVSELESFRSKNPKKFDREYSDLNLQIQAWRRRALGDGKAWDAILQTYSKNGHAKKTAPSRYLPIPEEND